MILDFTKRALQPGMTALVMQGSIHCGPECMQLEREVDGMIAARETRVIFDMAGVTHADSAAIGAIVRCLTKLNRAGGALRIAGQLAVARSAEFRAPAVQRAGPPCWWARVGLSPCRLRSYGPITRYSYTCSRIRRYSATYSKARRRVEEWR